MADDEQQDIPPGVEEAFADFDDAPDADASKFELPPEIAAAMNEEPNDPLAGLDAPALDTNPVIPDDKPKFFAPPEAQEAAPAVDFQMDQLPPEALATMERLQAEARPQQSQQQRRVQAASQQKAQQRRQRLGKPDTPQEQQSAQDVWASLQEDPFNEQAFNDSPAGQEFAAPQGPGNVAGGGGQGGGMEKLAQVGEQILAKMDQMQTKIDEMGQAMKEVAESMKDNESTSHYS